jgi:hypothetical protein
MPYCRECGREIQEATKYCPYCGAPIRVITKGVYARPRKAQWGASRILLLFVGFILLATSLGLLVGGGGILWAQSRLSDPEGFLVSYKAEFRTDAYALVQKSLNIDMDIPSSPWAPTPGDWVTLKLEARNIDPSKEIFIGIVSESYASAYLEGVEHDEITRFSWSFEPWGDNKPEVEYSANPGAAPAGPPIIYSFWTAHTTGPGIQTLIWEPEDGNFWVVAMNADGSAGVVLEASLGVRIPVLGSISIGLLVGGLVLFLLGGSIFYRGLYPRQVFF